MTNLLDVNGLLLDKSKLQDADLSYKDLRGANLQGVNLWDANLRGANLQGTNLSGAQGLLNPAHWLAENFEQDQIGLIVYKAIGGASYTPPASWVVEPGSFIEESVNPLPTVDCGPGVNFATLTWIKQQRYASPKTKIWECRIHWIDLASVVVPYNTDGKARTGRLELLRVVSD